MDAYFIFPDEEDIVLTKFYGYKTLSSVFFNGFSCKKCFINKSIFDYIMVYYDAIDIYRHINVRYNECSAWIAKRLNINPYGSFIIVKRKWDEKKRDYIECDIDMTPVQLASVIDKPNLQWL